MKVLLGMNLSPRWVQFFAAHAIEAVHWSAIGAPAASDNEILDYAGANGFVVFTHDLDFGILLAASNSRRPSVLQIRTKDVFTEPSRQLCARGNAKSPVVP